MKTTEDCQWFVWTIQSRSELCRLCGAPTYTHLGFQRLREGIAVYEENAWEHVTWEQWRQEGHAVDLACGCLLNPPGRNPARNLCLYHQGWNDALDALEQAVHDEVVLAEAGASVIRLITDTEIR